MFKKDKNRKRLCFELSSERDDNWYHKIAILNSNHNLLYLSFVLTLIYVSIFNCSNQTPNCLHFTQIVSTDRKCNSLIKRKHFPRDLQTVFNYTSQSEEKPQKNPSFEILSKKDNCFLGAFYERDYFYCAFFYASGRLLDSIADQDAVSDRGKYM